MTCGDVESMTPAGADPTRVLLVKGFFDDPTHTQSIHPLGLMYLASCLRQDHRHEVRIIDMQVDGITYDGLEKEIREFAPAFLGISALSAEVASMERIAAIAKKVDGAIKVVLGGPHASAYPRKAIESPHIDYVVVGEGEIVTGRLIDRVVHGEDVGDLAGLVYRRDGEIVDHGHAESHDDLDEIPAPAYDLVPIGDYKKFDRFSRAGSGDYMSLFTSRACPYRCIYCHNIFGRKYRTRSAEHVFREIRFLHDTYGIREFEVLDDVFNFDRKRVLEFCDRVIDSGLDVTFAFPNGLRGDILDEEQLVKLKEAGTIYTALAIETASPRIQKLIRKRMNVERIRRNIDIARRLRIHTHGFFMIGFPGETLEDMQMTVDFILSSNLHTFNMFIVMPFEGTELGRMAMEMGREVVTDFSQDYYARRFVNLTDVPEKTINRIRRSVLLRFYMNPRRAYHIMRDFPGNTNPFHLMRILYRRFLWKT